MTNPTPETVSEPPREESAALRNAAKRFLGAHATSAKVRAAMATERGWDPAVWSQMASELGWSALVVPEAYGGIGAGAEELATVFEEMGRVCACSPLFATVCLGVGAILECADEAQRSELLAPILEQAATATLAITESGAAWSASDVTTVAARADGGWSLRGTKRYVVDGHTADCLLVVAREEGSAGEDGIGVFAVPAGARGFDRRVVGTMDQTRRLAEVTLSGVHVPASARLGRADWRALERVLYRACAILAAEQVGGAARCLEMSVAYAKVRTQFQRPIGSFQAIKHRCADMLVDLECARSASLHAARVVASTASDDDVAIAASLAKAYCSEAFFRCAGETIQIHGGIGFTWDHDAHLFFKRAKSSMQLLGAPAHHRDAIARRTGLT
jgi:alkylation response protein AidB-like acyl-CoA dehydrogenase